ncbi:hypothetical protein V2W30_13195 [Streptomyces sp. Q6]|uniref:Uncharacterized protein n=1 Tax=Streptomyces citrinus TaxID=3118173 RepID=A0ACD5AAU3_9ACTN
MGKHDKQEGGRHPDRMQPTWGARVAQLLPLINLLIAIQKIVEEWILPFV